MGDSDEEPRRGIRMQPSGAIDERTNTFALSHRNPMPATNSHHLQGFCYQERNGILPTLTLACTDSGGWIVERRTLEQDVFEFLIEIEMRNIVEFYANLMASGIDLTRTAHGVLTGLSTCRYHLSDAEPEKQILSLRLELNFLEDVTLRSLLMTGSELA